MDNDKTNAPPLPTLAAETDTAVLDKVKGATVLAADGSAADEDEAATEEEVDNEADGTVAGTAEVTAAAARVAAALSKLLRAIGTNLSP